MEKGTSKKELLTMIIHLVEEIQEIDYIQKKTKEFYIQFIGESPISFKPSVSDKFLFRSTINKLGKNYQDDCGFNTTSKCYWINYGWWDEKELKKAKRE